MAPLSPKVVAFDGPWRHQMLHTRGIRLHAATMGEQTGPLVVLLHDALGGWFNYRPLMDKLATSGLHVAALDCRGYGMSDKPPAGYDLHNATGDIAGAIRTLGHDRAHVVGVGSGAAIAWALATSHPGHVASLITAGAIHPADMRAAILRAPWRYVGLLSFTTPMRLPQGLRKLYWVRPANKIARELRLNTGAKYQGSEAFNEEVRLRTKAQAIGSTFPGIAKTMRYQVNLPPIGWIQRSVDVPAHVLVNTSRARLEAKIARKRAATLHTFSIPDAKQRPHLEAPERFAEAILSAVTSAATSAERT